MSNLIGLYPMANGTLDGAPQTWVANTNDLLSAVVVTGYFTDKSDFINGNDFVNIIVDEDGTPALARGKIVDTGTASAPILTLDTSENSPSDLDLTEGNIIVGNASNVGTALDASTDNAFIIGNGTTVTSVALTGDVKATNAGVTAIGSAKVLLAMLGAGITPSHVARFGGTTTWAGAGTTYAATVTGVAAADLVMATVKTKATEASYLVAAVPTTDTITFELSAANTSNDAVIMYTVFNAAS
jgi:hypothetical protein